MAALLWPLSASRSRCSIEGQKRYPKNDVLVRKVSGTIYRFVFSAPETFTLTVFNDDLLEDVADSGDPSDLQDRLTSTIDEARQTTSDEDLDEMRHHMTSFLFCAPNGRDLIGSMTVADTPSSTTDG